MAALILFFYMQLQQYLKPKSQVNFSIITMPLASSRIYTIIFFWWCSVQVFYHASSGSLFSSSGSSSFLTLPWNSVLHSHTLVYSDSHICHFLLSAFFYLLTGTVFSNSTEKVLS